MNKSYVTDQVIALQLECERFFEKQIRREERAIMMHQYGWVWIVVAIVSLGTLSSALLGSMQVGLLVFMGALIGALGYGLLAYNYDFVTVHEDRIDTWNLWFCGEDTDEMSTWAVRHRRTALDRVNQVEEARALSIREVNAIFQAPSA